MNKKSELTSMIDQLEEQQTSEQLPSWSYRTNRGNIHIKPALLGKEILNTLNLMYVKNANNKMTLYKYNEDIGLWETETREEIERLITAKVDELNAWDAKEVNNTRKYILNKATIKKASETIDNINPFKVHFKNGVYNFDTEQLEPNKPENYIFFGRDYELDTSNKDTPLTDKWLTESLDNSKQFIMEYIGYIFYRSYDKFQNFTILLANGGNGKSTFFNWLSKAVGYDNISNVSLQALTDPNRRFTTSRLYQKNMNYYSDISKGIILDTSLIKSITGNDNIDVEEKGKQQTTIKPFAKQFFGANALPTFKDNAKGFGRRPMIVEFNTIEDFKKLYSMKEIEQEIPSFIYKCLKAFKQAYNRGYFSETERMKQLRDEWLKDNDITKLFIDEYCELGADYYIKKVDLYKQYKEFCVSDGYKPLSNQKLKRDLERFGVFDGLQRDGKDVFKAYKGIKLKNGSNVLQSQ